MEPRELSSIMAQNWDLLKRVERRSGVDVKNCYQCGKCSAGCPMAFAMDYVPRQIIRLLQLGFVDEALRSRTIWICAHCQTCYTRCPKEVDLPRLMEALRQEAGRAGLVTDKKVHLFDRAFLGSVERYGRVHEMGLIVQFNLQSGQPFKDAGLAPALFLNGKISPFPSRIKDSAAVKAIFQRVRSRGGAEH
ncbi:MAG: 4Fe-4S dicluster domain-containing protein [Thermanaeromonas sp.]|uniref:4Fe-4S dicluster domain-containing protein n=1 Tax=Thermanaeromonas sp. TaxID=2003697 RepID=UPI00243FFF70|nr:4Fe-4S dicluster domain-containing protein [Thermanaeromonas sp.]MCG0277012.1 4Fe-4S dicluster domain-containing protein [Thermanaeromonas sp.]